MPVLWSELMHNHHQHPHHPHIEYDAKRIHGAKHDVYMKCIIKEYRIATVFLLAQNGNNLIEAHVYEIILIEAYIAFSVYSIYALVLLATDQCSKCKQKILHLILYNIQINIF